MARGGTRASGKLDVIVTLVGGPGIDVSWLLGDARLVQVGI